MREQGVLLRKGKDCRFPRGNVADEPHITLHSFLRQISHVEFMLFSSMMQIVHLLLTYGYRLSGFP